MYYYDLGVRAKRDRDREGLTRRALELGWDCVAWTTALAGKLSAAAAQQTRPWGSSVELDLLQRREVLLRRSLVKPQLDLVSASTVDGGGGVQLRQLSRLSVMVDDVADAQLLTVGNDVVKEFDIIAATPGNAKIFAHLCKTADIDIISLDMTRKLPFQLNKKLVDEAVGRGICFELCYSGVLSSSGARRELLSSSRTLVQYLRGRNIILSSNAIALAQLRGPADVINVASALGLNAESALDAVGRNAALVVKHACCRKLRYLPTEIVSHAEFHARWPELTLSPPPLADVAVASKKRQRQDDAQEQGEEEEEEEEEQEEEKEDDKEAERGGTAIGPGDKMEGGEDYLAL